MNVTDATTNFLAKYKLEGIETECKAMIADETKHLQDLYRGRRFKYGQLVKMALENVCKWYEDASSSKIYLSWSSLRQFLGCHSRACTWAILLGLETHKKNKARIPPIDLSW